MNLMIRYNNDTDVKWEPSKSSLLKPVIYANKIHLNGVQLNLLVIMQILLKQIKDGEDQSKNSKWWCYTENC